MVCYIVFLLIKCCFRFSSLESFDVYYMILHGSLNQFICLLVVGVLTP